MREDTVTKGRALDTIESMIKDGIIKEQDLLRFKYNKINEFEPEYIRTEMEQWYKALGIEYITKEKFTLQLPYFTKEEIKESIENDELILCVPKGISKKQLGKLFCIDSWALTDNLIADTTEENDFWFIMKKSSSVEHNDKPGTEVKRLYEKEGKLGLTLERYMVFIARMRYLENITPDTNTKAWITRGMYEKNAMLIAGFDSEMKFSVHGWLKHFHSPYIGGRYVRIADHHYI
ncbi:MAG: hypothetical protein K2M60_01535 [Lachnospiraceae bacterium]|nr:hypothetical protein [Lachnospiraceae bacterium]MDE6251588.1 hypothetical protein [Lachnospiraceae bacterium]